MKTVVVGAGAIGGALAGFATRAGQEITVVDASASHVEAIRRGGLRIIGAREFTTELDIREPHELDFGYDMAVIATGLPQLGDALVYIEPHLRRSGCVLTLQNGLAAVDAAEVLGADRVLPGCVSFAGVLDGPGRIRLAASGPVHVGEFSGPVSTRVEAAVEVFRAFDSVQADDNVWGFIWAKLAIAAGFVALAIDGRPNVEIYGDIAQRTALCSVFAEVAVIAQACGINLEPIKSIDIDPLGRRPDVPERYIEELFDALLSAAQLGAADKPYSGIQVSLAAGEPTEAYALLEPVIARGNQLAVPTDQLTNLLDVLHRLESRRLEASPGLLRASTGVAELKGADQ